MSSLDPLDAVLSQPDRPVAPSPAFARRLRERVMAELAPDAVSGGEPRPMHDAHVWNGAAAPRVAPVPARLAPRTRRRWLPALEAAAVILLMLGAVAGYFVVNRPQGGQNAGIPAAATPATDAGPAAMWGGDAGRSGTHPGPGPAGEVALRWRTEPDDGFVMAQPPVALGNRIYRLTSNTESTDTMALVDAHDAATGELVWSVPLNAIGSPAVTERLVYLFVIETPGTRGASLVALDAADGEEAWRVLLGDSGGLLGTSPIVAAGVVYVADPDGSVYAFDATTGDERWTSRAAQSDDPRTEARGHDEGENMAGSGTFAVGDDHVYVVNAGGEVVALDIADGEEVWRFTVRDRYRIAPSTVTPIAAGDVVVLQILGYDPFERQMSTFINIVALVGAEDGGGYWTQEYTSRAADAPTVPLEEEDAGPERPYGVHIFGQIAVADDQAIVPLSDGSIVGIDLREGREAWRVNGLGQDGFGLVVAGDRVYSAGTDGNVRAFDLTSGEEAWRVGTGQPLTIELAVAGGAVYVADHAGSLYAYAGADGTPTADR